ncbi:MAG: hypothetical protein QXZ31_08330 [Thermofilaceae archaeon]
MNRALAVIANSLAFFLSITLAAFAAQYSPLMAALLALSALDPLLDVYSYVTVGKPNGGAVQLLLEGLNIFTAVLLVQLAALYFSFGYAALPALMLAYSLLVITVSVADAKAAVAGGSVEAVETPYLERGGGD